MPGRAANAIVCAEDALKATVAVPTDQLADVELFVHEPLTVQDSEPKTMYDAVAVIETLPVMLTAPDVDVSPPPDNVSPAPAVRAFVPLARVPPESVRSPAVVSWLRRVRVPLLTRSTPNEALPPIRRVPVPENATVELVAVKVVAEEVSQLPELIVIVAEANVNVAPPLAVKEFVPNATVPAFVNVRVPVHVSDPANVVETAGLTMRLFTV